MDVTVLIPAFNAASTIGETLASVLEQVPRPDRIVVVNDGSTDATGEVARNFPGVEIVSQENAGAPAAMNAGMRLASSEALALLDADDVMPKGRLARQCAILAGDPNLSFVVGEVEEFVCPSLSADAAASLRPRTRQTGWLCGATLVRTRAFAQIGPMNEDLRIGAWIDWIDRARKLGLKFQIEKDLALRRRLRPGTLSSSATRDQDMLKMARLALLRRRDRPT